MPQGPDRDLESSAAGPEHAADPEHAAGPGTAAEPGVEARGTADLIKKDQSKRRRLRNYYKNKRKPCLT